MMLVLETGSTSLHKEQMGKSRRKQITEEEGNLVRNTEEEE